MILYKYMSLQTALVVLRNQTLGFSRPSFFNDPFDRPFAQRTPDVSLDDHLFGGLRADIKAMAWELHTAILSLTRTPTNALMWAHYADHHRGVVLAIDTALAGLHDESSNMIPAHFGNVVYARHRPVGPYHSRFDIPVTVGATFAFVISHYEKWQRMFLIKPIEWAYEEEVRVVKSVHSLSKTGGTNQSGRFTIVDLDRPLHCFHLPPGSIVGVYAGARMDRAALATLRTAGEGVGIAQAIADQTTYEITVPPIVDPTF